MSQLDQLITRVGGEKNATIMVGAAGAGLVWYVGRRKNAKAQTAPVNVMAQGYSDTANDPTAVYTGYDQLQQEIDNLRGTGGASSTGNPSGNQNPVPTPTSPGSPPPVAPIPAPLPDPATTYLNQIIAGQPPSPASIMYDNQQNGGRAAMGGPSITGYGQSIYGRGPGGGGGGGGGGWRPGPGFGG